MTKAQELANPNSCLNKAADDEPIFVLRGQDRLAPFIVEQWAEFARLTAAKLGGEVELLFRPKYEEAVALAKEMRAWGELHKSKNPD